MKQCLVIGMGSAGARHASILTEMGLSVSVVSARENLSYRRFTSVGEAFSTGAYDYVVIANKTADHHDALTQLLEKSYRGLVLVEKPVVDRVDVLPECNDQGIYVGYNLRFHPVISKVKEALRDKALYSMHCYVGQYLGDWRPARDYASTYSAHRDEGGGVLRDLSHELDMILWLAGDWRQMTARGGRFSDLQIDSDDSYSLLLETTRCPLVVCQMNYLDRQGRRELVIHFEDGTIRADLVSGIFTFNDKCERFEVPPETTYTAMHKALVDEEADVACTLKEGMDVVALVEEAEKASQNAVWSMK